MANLVPNPSWDGVYQLETTDLVLGGPGGVANTPAQNLANQNLYARKHGGALPFLAGLSYDTGDRVKLTNGDIVVSLEDANTDDPNADMTKWKNESKSFTELVYKLDSLSELKALTPFEDNRRVSIKGYGDGELYWDALSTETANDITIFQSDTTATGRWKWVKFLSVAQGGVISDGVTDQTTRINEITDVLGATGFRGRIQIPENTKFDVSNVFASLPIGVNLKIFDNVNWGQPPGYKNRMIISYGTGTTADDSLHMFADNHHTAISLNNLGTAGSVSADERLASIAHAVGISYAGDPLNAQILQFRKDANLDKWIMSTRTLIPYEIAMKDPSAWVSGKIYAAGAMCLSDGNKVYRTTLGGTAGATAPTGTGTGLNDGGVIWDYYAARRSRDATTFTVDEDGNAANYGNTGATTSYQVRNAVNRLLLQVDNTTTGTVSLRDFNRGVDFLTSATARGTYLGGVPSLFFGAVLSGATPSVSTAAHRVTNAGATTMTSLGLPAGQTHGFVLLLFTDANTTIQNGAAFALKGAVNANPPANGIIQLVRNGSIGSQWVEVSRSF